MKKLYRQYNLGNTRSNDNVKQYMSAWLIDGLEMGWKVTLKDSKYTEEYWEILGMGQTLLPKDELHRNSKWNNNI